MSNSLFSINGSSSISFHQLFLLFISICVTQLFGIDNISGKFHYVTYLPNFTGFNNEKIQLVVQRTSKHYPHRAQCLVIAKHKVYSVV